MHRVTGLVVVLAALALLAPGTATARTSCGTVGVEGLRLTVFRISGTVSCRRARRLSRHVVGARCQGERIAGGYRCRHGAPALHEPANSGFTLRRGRNVIEGRVR